MTGTGRQREPPAYKKRACPPGNHEFSRNDSGMRFCDHCGLSRQTLVDFVGQKRGNLSR